MIRLVLYLTILVSVTNSFHPSSVRATAWRQPPRLWPAKAIKIGSRQTPRPTSVSRRPQQPLSQGLTLLHAKINFDEETGASVSERSADRVRSNVLNTDSESNDAQSSAAHIEAVTFLTLGLFVGVISGGGSIPTAIAIDSAASTPTDAGVLLGDLLSHSVEQAQLLWSQNTQPEVIAERMAEADALWLKSSQFAAEASVQAKDLSTTALLATQEAMVAAEPVVKVAVSEAVSFADSALITLSRLVDIVVKLVKDVYPLVDEALKNVSLRSTSSESALVFAAVATLLGLVIKSFSEQAPSAASIERLEKELEEKKKRRQRAVDAKEEAKRAAKEREEAEKQLVERAAQQQEAIAAKIRDKEEAAQRARREVSLKRSNTSSKSSKVVEAASSAAVAQAAVATAAAAAAQTSDAAVPKKLAPQGAAVKSKASDATAAVAAQVSLVEATATEAIAAAHKVVEEAAAAQKAADERAAKEIEAEKKAAKEKEVEEAAAAAEVTKATTEAASTNNASAVEAPPKAAAEKPSPNSEKAAPVPQETTKSTEAPPPPPPTSMAPRREVDLSGSEAAVLGAVAGAALLGPVGLPVGFVVGSAGALWNAVQKVESKERNSEPFDEDIPPPPPPGPPPK